MRGRIALFVALCILCIAGGGAYLVHAMARTHPPAALGVEGDEPALSVADVIGRPYVLFRSSRLNDRYGVAAVAPLKDPDGERAYTNMTCARVDMAGGRGLCLEQENVLGGMTASIFDERLGPLGRLKEPGVPSRTRVAPSGHLAATTAFVSGHSYAGANFSTRTVLIDLRTNEEIGNLEDFQTIRDGQPFSAVDFNFWGVTFADDNRFFATLGTGGNTFLVEGDVAARRLTVLESGVECPSLSPDGTRIAFKQRNDAGFGPVEWHIAVLTLDTGAVTHLAEQRNVDDQVAWLDDETVMYGLPRDETGSPVTDVWVVPADGTGQPAVFIHGASSPRVVH